MNPVVNSGIVISQATAASGSHVMGRQSTPMIRLITSNSVTITVSMCSKVEVSIPGNGMRSAAPRNGAVIVPTTTMRSPSRGSVFQPKRRRSGPSGYHSAAITQATRKSAAHAARGATLRRPPKCSRDCRSNSLVSVALM